MRQAYHIICGKKGPQKLRGGLYTAIRFAVHYGAECYRTKCTSNSYMVRNEYIAEDM